MPDACPKCGQRLASPHDSTCQRCGLIFAKWMPERRKLYPSQIIVSTTRLAESFETVAPVYAITTNQKGVLDQAAKRLGLDTRAITESELLSSLFLGDSVANYQAFPIAFAVCVEQLKIQAAALGCDAVIGIQMNFDLDRSGIGLSIFTMQLFGTAVRRSRNT